MPLHTDKVPVNQIFQDPDAGAELDKIFDSIENPDAVKSVVDPVTPPANDSPDTTDDGLPAVQPTDDDTPPVDPATPPTDPVDPPTDKSASRVPSLDDPTADPVPPAVDDPVAALIKKYDLPASASQKSKDTFANLKALSEEALRLANQKSAAIKAEYEAKLAAAASAAPQEKAADPQIEEELKKLREFRATFDIENDPEFQKSFVAKQESNYGTIYGVLTQHGLPESELKALKELPEADRVTQIGELMDKLPSFSKTKIQAKLMANMNLDEERQTALQAAVEKARAAKQQLAEAPAKQKEQTLAEIKAAAAQYQSTPVFKKVDIKAGTPPEEKKRLEAANQNVDRLSKLFNDVLLDNTPQAKAESAYGVVLAHHFKAQAEGLSEQLKKANAELAEIKKRSGVADKGRVVNVPTNKSGQRPNPDADSGSSLDQLARDAGIQV